MARVRLIHWKAAEAVPHQALLAKSGHQVEYQETFENRLLRSWRESPPAAFVIDLSRLPSHGREIAVALRQSKSTRSIPIVFCGGAPEKVAKTRQFIPDAIFCELPKLNASIKQALTAPPAPAIVPTAMMDRYAGRSTAQKLGIKPGHAVLVCDPPRGFPALLGELPANVQFVESPATPAAVAMCFVTEPDLLRERLSEFREIARVSKFWVCWRKGKSTPGSVSERLVRETGISLGLVDYKICSVSEVWSGLLFACKSEK